MDRRQFLDTACNIIIGGVIFGGFSGLLMYLGKQTNKYSEYKEHPVDQVFRDYDGYRIEYRTGENSLCSEKYLDRGDRYGLKIKRPKDVPPAIKDQFLYLEKDFSNEVFIIKDLEEESKGFVRVLSYIRKNMGTEFQSAYAEIHIPKSQQVIPGILEVNENNRGGFPVWMM